MLENLNGLGVGGAKVSGGVTPNLATALAELQGLNILLLAGAAANTKINLAAIRSEDTIVAAFNNNAGTLTDITGTMSIDDTRASGTVSVGATAAGDTVTVAGLTYTLVANGTNVAAGDYTKVKVGASATDCATNLAAAINARESRRNTAQQVTASAATTTVTVRAVVDGTAGNSIALAEVGNTFTVSGATLANGTATGGVRSTGVTNQIMLFWYNKR